MTPKAYWLGPITLVLVLSGCAESQTSTGSEAGSSSQQSSTDDHGESQKGPEPITVGGSSTLIAPYFEPTLQRFAEQSVVKQVVIGTVTGSVAEAIGGMDVVTNLELNVESSSEKDPARSMTLRVSGGTVQVRDLRPLLEGRMSEEELEEQSDRDVVFESELTVIPDVGDQILAFLATEPGGETADVLTLLILDADSTYRWPVNRAPNPNWGRGLSRAAAVADFGLSHRPR